MKRRRIRGRRSFLKAVGMGAAAAPWIPLLPSHAEDGASPRRVLFVHFAHGVARDRWSASDTLAPLAPFAERMVVVEGLDNAVGRDQVGDVHNIALGTLLSASPLAADFGPGGHYLPGDISIDQRLGQAFASRPDAPPFSTLHFGVRTQGFAWSALGCEQPVRAEDDPVAAYDRLFGELALDPSVRASLHSERRSSRDFVRRRLDDLSRQLPVEDRDKLEIHLDAIDQLDARMDDMRPSPSTCVVPMAAPAVEDPEAPADSDVPALVRAQSELVTATFACDLTRVATLQWGSSGNDGLRHTWQGIDEDFHTLAHLANGEDPQAHEHFAQMNLWYAQELAALLASLDAVEEGDGTLLDHTLVVWLSGVSVVHHMGDLPVLLVGGGMPGGRHLSYEGVSHSALWIALAQHLGVAEVDHFGDPNYDVGALPGLV